MKARIIHSGYQNLCFCERPALPASAPVQYEPRFNFKAAVRSYCKAHNLGIPQFNRIDKSALADMPTPCQHRDLQTVRITWEVDWSNS